MLRGQTRLHVPAISTCVELAQGHVHSLWEQMCHKAQLQMGKGPYLPDVANTRCAVPCEGEQVDTW